MKLSNSQRALGAQPEQRPVFRHCGDLHRRALAADMAVEADHPVGSAHHHMQVVADHADRGAGFAPDPLDQPVE
jgi:hypothetical protein